jgi:hypothetical protein
MKTLLLTLQQTTKDKATPQARKSIRISNFFACLLFTLALVLMIDSFGQGITGLITGDVIDASAP